jgi:hypothetical protein
LLWILPLLVALWGCCGRKKSQEELITPLRTNFLCDDFVGGARMMEAAYSLMQLAKTSVKLAIGEAKLPYIPLDQQLVERQLHMLC